MEYVARFGVVWGGLILVHGTPNEELVEHLNEGRVVVGLAK